MELGTYVVPLVGHISQTMRDLPAGIRALAGRYDGPSAAPASEEEESWGEQMPCAFVARCGYCQLLLSRY